MSQTLVYCKAGTWVVELRNPKGMQTENNSQPLRTFKTNFGRFEPLECFASYELPRSKLRGINPQRLNLRDSVCLVLFAVN
jgi:hypothetical protein